MLIGKQHSQAGFTYITVLTWLTVLALFCMKSFDNLSIQWRQDNEAQLLFAGNQIRNAIQTYRDNPSGNKCYPVSMDQLLSDKRGTRTIYPLRRRYPDPITGKNQWGMIYDEAGRWVGVFSLGKGKPLKKTIFPPGFTHFDKAKTYQDWTFMIESSPDSPLPEKCR